MSERGYRRLEPPSPRAVVVMDWSLDLHMQGLDKMATTAAIAAFTALEPAVGPPAVVAYNETARLVDPADLAELKVDAIYGTNLQHALRLARVALASQSSRGRALVIAHTEPTAHLRPDGAVLFCFPPTSQTASATLDEGRACAEAGIRVDVLMLTTDSPIDPLAAQLTEECGGAVGRLADGGDLGQQVQSFLSAVRLI